MAASIFLIVVAFIIKTIFDFFIRKQLLDAGPVDENAIKFLKNISDLKLEPLKWGLLSLSGGIGLIVIEFLPYKFNDSPLPYGVEAIFLSIGFLVYYYIVRNQKL